MPAKTLDDLTDQLSDRTTINVYPSKAEMAKGDNFAKRPDIEQTQKPGGGVFADDPPPNPPTPEEVATDQAQLADEFSGEFARVGSAGQLDALLRGVVNAVKNGTLTEHQASGLYELANSAKERLSKVKT